MRRLLGGAAFAAFASPAYRRFIPLLLVTMTGFWLRIAALGWFVYELTGSRTWLGVLTAAAMLPWVLGAPLSGVLADRCDPRRLMRNLLLAIAALNIVLGTGILLGVVGLPALLAITMATGLLRGMEHPARHAVLVRLVPRAHLRAAVGMHAATFHLTAATGPALGGLAYHLAGAGACFLIVAASVLPMALVVGRLPLRDIAPPPRRRIVQELLDGVRHVVRHRRTALVLATAAASVVFLWSFRTLLAPLAKDRLGLGELGYGVLMGLVGVGSFVGALRAAGSPATDARGIPRILGLVLAGATLVAALSVAGHLALVVPLLVAAGFCNVAFMARCNVLVQSAVPDALRGRVMGLWALVFGLCWPLGSVWMGAVAEWLDLRGAMLLGVAGTLVVVAIAALARTRVASTIAREHEAEQLLETPG